MLKHHKLISLAIGVLFVIVLQEFSTPVPIFRFMAAAFIVYTALVTLYNRWYLKQINKYSVWTLLRPILLFASGFGIFLILPTPFLQGMFLVTTVFLIFVFEFLIGKFSENFLIVETLVIAFGLFISHSAFNVYFPSFHNLYVITLFAGVFLLARSFNEYTPESDRVKTITSLGISLFCSELFWALAFLPFHYSALSLILFNIFYFFIILNYYYSFNILNTKKVTFHFALMVACSLFILIITPWNILT